MSRRAFTIIELLATIAVIAILLAILIPALSSVRQQGSELLCATRIRNAGFAITQYTEENRGFLPFAGYTVNAITNPAHETIYVGGTSGFAHSQWVNIMPDYWTGDLWPESMMCPDQPPYDPAFTGQWPNVDLLTDGFRRQPFFDLSAAFHIAPQSLDKTIDPVDADSLIVQPQRIHNVTYPSSKSMLYEFYGFCVDAPPEYQFWIENLQTWMFATSVVAVDGSAYRYAQRNAIRPALGVGIDYTFNGIRGRDIDHAFINQDALGWIVSDEWVSDPTP